MVELELEKQGLSKKPPTLLPQYKTEGSLPHLFRNAEKFSLNIQIIEVLNEGERFLQQKKYDHAVAAFERVLAVIPNHQKCNLALADSLFYKKMYHRCLLIYIEFGSSFDIDRVLKRLKGSSLIFHDFNPHPNEHTCERVAHIYFYGLCVPVNYKKAIVFYKKAVAEDNCPKAAYMLGKMYDNGICVAKDTDRALYYFKFGAEKNHVMSVVHVSEIFEKKKMVAETIYFCKKYLKISEEGHKFRGKVLFRLGMLFKHMQEREKALLYLNQAREKEYKGALFQIGDIYQTCKPINMKKAISLYLECGKGGFYDAFTIVGMLYCIGEEILIDYKKAVEYFNIGYEMGSEMACTCLGLVYANGWGVPQNFEYAADLFQRAAQEHDESDAWYFLGKMLRHGIGVRRDYKQSKECFKREKKAKQKSRYFDVQIKKMRTKFWKLETSENQMI
jgi:TPR repeat protein